MSVFALQHNVGLITGRAVADRDRPTEKYTTGTVRCIGWLCGGRTAVKKPLDAEHRQFFLLPHHGDTAYVYVSKVEAR